MTGEQPGLRRRREHLPMPAQGWHHPWPHLFEIADTLSTKQWTLIGGLMVQAHAIGHGIPETRPTADLDMLLHIEVEPGITSQAHRRLKAIGYHLQEPFDRHGPHYRYLRGQGRKADKVDVMAADHAAPRARQKLEGRPMFEVHGGTQALRRTMIYAVDGRDSRYDISVPDELGALVLKGAAYIADRRDRERHLFDAVVLAACISDPVAEIARLHGSDRARIATLADQLADPQHRAWLAVDTARRTVGQDTLRILASEPRSAAILDLPPRTID